MALITLGCDGRSTAAARQALVGETLLQRAIRTVREVGPERIVVSLPDDESSNALKVPECDPMVRPAGATTLESAVAQALEDDGGACDHVLTIDPLLPLRRPGRLAQALTLAMREGADCVFSCHCESALLWQRSDMGLVPYFDPARRPGLDARQGDVPWLVEDGGFYLLSVATFLRTGSRHGGRIAPLETAPAEAVVADDSAGLAVCRALLAERERVGVAS
jgi:CMP-N-acetylneuraminic acid synthetase